jgi:type I restriction enzyme S subunit
MAQAIFKSWFVDFEPFRDGEFEDSELGPIPKGWRVVDFEDVFFFFLGPGIRNWQYVTEAGINFINLRCIKNNDLQLNTANMISIDEANGKYAHFMLKEWDVVVSSSGTLGRYAIVRKEHLPLCLNTSVIRFSPKKNFEHFSFLFGYLTAVEFYDHLITKSCGSVQANFGPMHLRQIRLIFPPDEVLNQYHKTVFPLIRKCIQVRSEDQLLTSLRDSLLPKLMSGEILVPEEVQ